jgi:flagellar biosynthesis/type III secretory pathway protein FliH
LDGQVEESNYQSEIIQQMFALIKKDKTTPQEYARMKDEYANEQWMRKRGEKERQEGIKKGIEKGRIIEKQQTLIKILTLKFEPISETIIDTIHATIDLEQLDHWFNQIIVAEHIDDIVF